MKTAESLEDVIRDLYPKLAEFAVTPIMGEDELVERQALMSTAFMAQHRLRGEQGDPETVAPGWNENFITLVREIGNADAAFATRKSPTGQLEARRNAMILEGRLPFVMPEAYPDPKARLLHSTRTAFTASVPSPQAAPRTNVPAGAMQLRMSEVLQRFLDHCEKEDGDRRAESEIGPINKIAIELLGDPILMDVTGDQLLRLKGGHSGNPDAARVYCRTACEPLCSLEIHPGKWLARQARQQAHPLETDPHDHDQHRAAPR